ncbi:Gibberellin 3-beta-dioxygenase 1, partial [Linum grandiflorum]
MVNISSNTMTATTKVSDAYAQSPLKSHQIVPLDFNSIQTTLPETHVWPPGAGDQSFPIPVIDFSAPSEISRKLIVEACEKWGVFQLTNHGIPSELLTEVEAQARRLFALPASRKLNALRSPNGVSGYGQARISQFFEKHMWNEGFTVVGSPADHAAQLWPEDDRRRQVFCDVIEDYRQRTRELAAKLLRLILQSLNTSEQEIRRISSPESTVASLQLNSYPPCPDPTRVMGMAPHTDTSLLTLVYQGSVKGLEIFSGGEWGIVPPVAGAVTVNVGDLLHVISNGRFQTVRHRVVLKEAAPQRVSVALFYFPTPEFVLSPSGLVSGDVEAPILYRSLTVKEYIGVKYKSYQTALDAIKK